MSREITLAGLTIAVFAAVLFGAAGRIDWPMAWTFLAVYTAFAVAAFLFLDPGLIRERGRGGSGIDRLDVALASASGVGSFVLTLLVAGLDTRFEWSPSIPLAAQIGALAGFILGHTFAFWAMLVNKFFSTFVRIQKDRGHHVISSGPYAYVRHPGYSGTILSVLLLPIALGSLWALVPAVAGSALFAVRTLHEDGTLQRELVGYREYVSHVRWRLLPGVW